MNHLIRQLEDGRRVVALPPGARVLFLFRDSEMISRQLRGEIALHARDVDPGALLDDISTDVMAPAWVCLQHDPAEIAREAYAGLLDDRGERVLARDALVQGGFQAIVSGTRKGTGSSREQATQAERFAGVTLAVASSFAPIHRRNNVNLGQLMADHETLARLQDGEVLPLDQVTAGWDPLSRSILEAGGLFPFLRGLREGRLAPPPPRPAARQRPMTGVEKLLVAHRADGETAALAPGDTALVEVDAGYSHEFTSAQVHATLVQELGPDYAVRDAARFAVFEDHLLHAEEVERLAPHAEAIATLRRVQREFQAHTGVRDYTTRDGISPGICHQVAREDIVEPADLVLATDSHTCMAGGSGALGLGVGATEYAAALGLGLAAIEVPESIRFELTGRLSPSCTAKDVMLHVLERHAAREETLDRVIEFGGPGLTGLSMDERATLANMATECSARSALCDGDELCAGWIAERRPDRRAADLAQRFVRPDPGAAYHGGVHEIDLASVEPMVATPGDPTFGRAIAGLGEVAVDIAYGGSCTAGKAGDLDDYARVLREARAAGRGVAAGVQMFVQFGSLAVREHSRAHGYLELFEAAGVTLLDPGCGACIGCGPGVSTRPGQVTISAINRNFPGRSGPGSVYLASPLSVAASAVAGHICAYRPGSFS